MKSEIEFKNIKIKEGNPMQKKSLVVIDIQNDITKNYKEIIDNVNRSIVYKPLKTSG